MTRNKINPCFQKGLCGLTRDLDIYQNGWSYGAIWQDCHCLWGELLFEIEGPAAGRVSKDMLTSSLEGKFADIMGVVKEAAENAHLGLLDIGEKAKPSEYTMKFGLKMGLGSNLIFAKAESEGTFEITLKWIKPDER